MIRIITIVLLATLASCRAAHSQSSPAPQTPTTAIAAPVAAIWYESASPPRDPTDTEMRRLIVGVWGDGSVVWSNDRAHGGRPYQTAKIPLPLVQKLLHSLKFVGFFDAPAGGFFGPDASITVLAATDGSSRQWLGSWHDPPTTHPRVIIDQRGISSIEPAEPKSKPSSEYARFLEVWAESRRLIESIVPTDGEELSELDERIFRLRQSPR